MTEEQWEYFVNFRERFRDKCRDFSQRGEKLLLKELQEKIQALGNTPYYPVENSVVYNRNLDKVKKESRIDYVLVGDNPGKNEQLEVNSSYLVGLSGKIGEGFFKKNPGLKTDFRENIIILNKAPIHSPKTKDLRDLIRLSNGELLPLLNESQIWMAEETFLLAQKLDCPVWIIGYSELKPKGVFSKYGEKITELAGKEPCVGVFLFQHFSMNRFTIDLNAYMEKNPGLSLTDALIALGTGHRKDVLGW